MINKNMILDDNGRLDVEKLVKVLNHLEKNDVNIDRALLILKQEFEIHGHSRQN